MRSSYVPYLVLATLLSVGTAYAEDKMEPLNCTEADMATMQSKMEGMTDADKKNMAMSEMDMAKKMMADKDMDGCKIHMDNAMGHMGMMDMMKK